MYRLLAWVCGATALYPFTTSEGGPVCKVPQCASCNVALVEYSQKLDIPNVSHHIVGGLFWEDELPGGVCCGDNCGRQGSILTQGYGECVDSGESRHTWSCGLCSDARCSCRRLSLEIIPNQCVKCISNYSVTPSSQCSQCPVDHVSDGVTCTAVDKCANGGHNCDKHATCTFTGPGRFSCTCFKGYTGTGMFCSETDPCAADTHVCNALALCSKTGPGLFNCTCKPGYQGDGKVCRDVDECSGPTRLCAASEFCENTPGSYVCTPCHEECSRGCVGAGPDQCQQCKGYSMGDNCVAVCPLGSFADAAVRQCRPCDSECAGECNGEGRNACAACAHVAFTASDGSTVCLAQCPAGHFPLPSVLGHVCTKCSASLPGSFITSNCSAEEDTMFLQCPPGYYCDGHSSPAKCEPGWYQPAANSTRCLEASAGFFTAGSLAQQRCGAGYISAAGASRCEACPAGRWASANQTSCEDECGQSGIHCPQKVSVRESVPSWPWIVFGLGAGCCLCTCLGFGMWHRKQKTKTVKVQTPEDVALTTLDEHEDLVGPGSTKSIPDETDA